MKLIYVIILFSVTAGQGAMVSPYLNFNPAYVQVKLFSYMSYCRFLNKRKE